MATRKLSNWSAPDGKLMGSVEALHDAGCIQTLADTHDGKKWAELHADVQVTAATMFLGLHTMTHQNPCNGCPIDRSKCQAFKMYHTSVNATPLKVAPASDYSTKYPGLTVAQIADKLGVSKSQVRKMKLEGAL